MQIARGYGRLPPAAGNKRAGEQRWRGHEEQAPSDLWLAISTFLSCRDSGDNGSGAARDKLIKDVTGADAAGCSAITVETTRAA